MGIDGRQDAMANQDVRRGACVGCGMCAHVCPRGVLKLENKPLRCRAGEAIRVYAVDLLLACPRCYRAVAREASTGVQSAEISGAVPVVVTMPLAPQLALGWRDMGEDR